MISIGRMYLSDLGTFGPRVALFNAWWTFATGVMRKLDPSITGLQAKRAR